jgi:hypothetical protein
MALRVVDWLRRPQASGGLRECGRGGGSPAAGAGASGSLLLASCFFLLRPRPRHGPRPWH